MGQEKYMDQAMLDAYRQQYTKPHEQLILDWVERVGVEHVIFYPQGNPTILLVWIRSDRQENFLFREIDLVVEGDGVFRVSGGATYHEPTYRLAWLPQRHLRVDDLEETLSEIKTQVDALEFGDLVDMDAYLSTLTIRLEA